MEMNSIRSGIGVNNLLLPSDAAKIVHQESQDSRVSETKKLYDFYFQEATESLFGRSAEETISNKQLNSNINKLIPSILSYCDLKSILQLQLVAKGFFYLAQQFGFMRVNCVEDLLLRSWLLNYFNNNKIKVILTIDSIDNVKALSVFLDNQENYINHNNVMRKIHLLDLEKLDIDDTNTESINLLLTTIFTNSNCLPEVTKIVIGNITTKGCLSLPIELSHTSKNLRNFIVGNVNNGDGLNEAKSLASLGIIYKGMGGEKNIEIAINYLEKALKIWSSSPFDKHSEVLYLLNNLLEAYFALKEKKDIRKSLKFCEIEFSKRRKLFSGDNLIIIKLLNNFAQIYHDMGVIKKSLSFREDALKMRQELVPGASIDMINSLDNLGRDYFDYGKSYKTLAGEGYIREGLKHREDSLKMRQELASGPSIDMVNSLYDLGNTYYKLGKSYIMGGAEDIQRGRNYMEKSLNMRQQLFPGKNLSMANCLMDFCTKNDLNETRGWIWNSGANGMTQKCLRYSECALNMQQELLPNNHKDIAESLGYIGVVYYINGDQAKGLEYLKQAHSMYLTLLGEESKIVKDIMSVIEIIQPNYFSQILLQQKVSYCRRTIFSRGELTDNLIPIKLKIQNNVLNKIVQAVVDYGWSSPSLSGDWGVKGYIETNYIKRQLGALGNNDLNIQTAQMLCFESMNLGVMKFEKNYNVVVEFTRANVELVKKIAVEHPEFFVEGSIVECCIGAMQNNSSFKQHLFEHVKYVKMEELMQQRKTASFSRINK